jgi:hypothetical protein
MEHLCSCCGVRGVQVQTKNDATPVLRHVHMAGLACRVLLVGHHASDNLAVGNEQLLGRQRTADGKMSVSGLNLAHFWQKITYT